MNQPPNAVRATSPWVLVGGLVLGAALLVSVFSCSPSAPSKKDAHAKSDNVVEFTDANWQKEVLESDMPVFVDFWAEWCGPCLEFAPTVHKLADRFKGKVKVGTLNVDDQQQIARKYNVRSIPHLMIFQRGEAVPFRASRSEADLARVLDGLLAKR